MASDETRLRTPPAEERLAGRLTADEPPGRATARTTAVTGVHYAGDVVIGAAIGATVGDIVGRGVPRLRGPRTGTR